MADNDDHPIRTGLIIAAGTLAIGYAATFIPGLFQWIWNVCKQCWHFLLATSKTPHWLIIALAIMAIPALWRFCRLFFPVKAEDEKPAPLTWRDYTEDSFLGAVWRWSYNYEGGIDELWCYCPRCDTRLVYAEALGGYRVCFTCELCNAPICEEEGGKDAALGKVFRQIDRKHRTGAWKQVVAARSANSNRLLPEE